MSLPPLIFAVPKGRIGEELAPLLSACGIEAEAAFFDPNSRLLCFATQDKNLSLVRVRAFDVASFVAYGAAAIGVVGNDVLEEFSYDAIYSPLDMGIGHCRLSLCAPAAQPPQPLRSGVLRVATKYPRLTSRFYAARGVAAECIALSGAMEIAPALGIAPAIVDLVASGKTLIANQLVEVETLLQVSSRLIVNSAAYKTRADVKMWVERLRAALSSSAAPMAAAPTPPPRRTRIERVLLAEKAVVRRRPEIEHELSLARADLLHNNDFRPIGFEMAGPFTLSFALEENRVRIEVMEQSGALLTDLMVPLSAFRSLMREYFMVCESYYDAIRQGAGPAQIETLDMGRRGLHNQGSEYLMEILHGKAHMDMQTARRLFTLICVLQIRG